MTPSRNVCRSGRICQPRTSRYQNTERKMKSQTRYRRGNEWYSRGLLPSEKCSIEYQSASYDVLFSITNIHTNTFARINNYLAMELKTRCSQIRGVIQSDRA